MCLSASGRVARCLLAVAVLLALIPFTTSAAVAPVAMAGAVPGSAGDPSGTRAGAVPPAPHPVVRGARLVDGRTGEPLRLAGVNRSGTEYACVQGWGFSDGPVDDEALARIAQWRTNVVRVPLNASCWLGRNGAPAQWSGSGYRDAVEALVERLHAQGQAVILDLHWSAPGDRLATEQTIAPDADHAPDLWRSVAARFADDPAVMFELFNEPREIGWDCWRDGCRTPEGWRAAGHQELLDAVRSTGARQPVVLDGLHWGGDLSGWAAHAPTDPLDQLVAGWHDYDFSQCSAPSCWEETAGTLARTVPVVLTEVGQSGCDGQFLARVLPWADRHDIGYVAWAWNAASCSEGPSLISDYDGTPTPYGAAYRRHLAETAAPDGAPTPGPAEAEVRMDFERAASGRAGWATAWGRAGVRRVTTGPARGQGVLSVQARRGYPALTTDRVGGLVGGSRVSAWVRTPRGVPASAVRPVVVHGSWEPAVLAPRPLVAGRWQRVSYVVPDDLGTIRAVGLQVEVGAARTALLRVDDVSW